MLTTANGGMASVGFALVVANVAPTVGPVVVPTDPVNIADQPVSAGAAFSDPAGSADAPYSCTVDYGDSAGPQAGSVLGTTCSGPDQTYAEAGVYEVTVAVTDKDGGTGSATAAVSIVVTPSQAIGAVLIEVQGIVAANPGTPLADKVEDAAAGLQAALDELAKTPPDNQAALGKVEGAVGDLAAALGLDPTLDPALLGLMDQLAGPRGRSR